MKTERFEALDAFRGLCALFVMLYHMNVTDTITEFSFFRNSKIFVEFFFVLSGFVLAHVYAFENKYDFKKYIKARFLRLYPLHFVMFSLFIVLQLVKLLLYNLGITSFEVLPFSEKSSILNIATNLLLLQSWTPYTYHLSFNAPSWSISIEFYLYILLFISFLIFRKYKLISWVLISSTSFILLYLDSKLVVRPVLSGLSCFFGGASVYAIFRQISDKKPSYFWGTFIEILLLIGIGTTIVSHLPYKNIFASVFFLFTVPFFALEVGFISKLLRKHFLQCLGKLSFSIYMTHFFIIFCSIWFFKIIQHFTSTSIVYQSNSHIYIDFGNILINNIFVIFSIIVVIFVSKITHKYIELPFQRLYKRV
ncbi:acyltransferase [Halosquirtibacter laminarini]|uniref:Acyltransferase n=1 Tax=Halosquirtibacter laminarini TaxID=3374600 RepID=A0AC61NGV3_9BACT|nr:acyltransferase [Prolixibacteraceae bacterium]